MDEHWYSRRKANLTESLAKAIQAKNWKNNLKFERRNATKFLAGIHTVARSFIENCYL